jgi:hypothetical protein
MTVTGYHDAAFLRERCEEGMCPRCDAPLFGSASSGPWCPGCEAVLSPEKARCPYPASATSVEGQRLCRVHAPLVDDAVPDEHDSPIDEW